MNSFLVKKGEVFDKEITVPGDKSISHRALMFSALSDGICNIEGLLLSQDCIATANILSDLGIKIENLHDKNLPVKVYGRGGVFIDPKKDMDCGNSGTTMRLMSGILASCNFECSLFGDSSLSNRPMNRIAIPLSKMGVTMKGIGDLCKPPLRIKGSKELLPITYESPVASAQIKSSIILAGLKSKGITKIIEPHLSRDHTEQMLRYFGVDIKSNNNEVWLKGPQSLIAKDIIIPGDISSAAFWIVASALTKGSHLIMNNVGLNPTRIGILNVLKRMGASINITVDSTQVEPMGKIEVFGSKLNATNITKEEIPTLIDEIPIIAVLASLSEGTTIIKGAEDLRVKESDRISVVVENLKKMGVNINETEDGMIINGGKKLQSTIINPQHDHRIAMSFAIAGIFAEGETIIEDSNCIETSYPDFISEIKNLNN